MHIDEAVKRACEESDLAAALAWICIWEAERVVKQVHELLQSSDKFVDSKGRGWNTCFETCIRMTMKAWEAMEAGVQTQPDLPECLITSSDFKQILAYYGYSGARIDRGEGGFRWVFYAPHSRPAWSTVIIKDIRARMPAGLQVSFYPHGVEVPDSASEH